MSTYKVSSLTATTIAATGIITASNATASTTTGTGAVVVTGGVGIGGAVYIGGLASVAGNLSIAGTTAFANITTVNLPGSSSTNGFNVLEAGLNTGAFIATQLGVAITTGNSYQTYFTYNGDNATTNTVTSGFNGGTTPKLVLKNSTGNDNITLDGNLTTTGTTRLLGTSTMTGNASFSGTINVSGAATFSSPMTATTISGTNISASGTLGVTGVSTLSNRVDVVLPGSSSTNGVIVTQQSLGSGNFVGIVHGNSTGLGNAAQHYFSFTSDNSALNTDTWRLYGSGAQQIQLVNNGTVNITGATNVTGTVAITGNQTVTGYINAVGSVQGTFFTSNGVDQLVYEKGTWTPTVTAFSGGIGAVSASITATRVASYVRIGSLVTVSLDITYNMLGCPINSCLVVDGLPFTKLSGSQLGLMGDTVNIAGATNPIFAAIPSSGRVYTGGAVTQFTSTGTQVIPEVGGVYITGQAGAVTGQIICFSLSYLA